MVVHTVLACKSQCYIILFRATFQIENGNIFSPFVPNEPFLYPLMFSGGTERVHWEQMGEGCFVPFQ